MTVETSAMGLSKRYGRLQPWVLDGVDVRFHPGTRSVVVGANGSGKSTLLRLLAGVSRPNRGVITRPQDVGYVPERLPARLQMTGRTYLLHMGRLRALDRADVAQRVEELADRLALTPGLDVRIGKLSKGNTRKVLLTQALLVCEGLLLLDEPFSGLDEVATEGLNYEISRAAARGATVVVTCHSPDTGFDADEVLHLVAGQVKPFKTDRGDSDRSGLTRIELEPPDDANPRRTPPDWMLPFHPIRTDRRWHLWVAAGPALDQLLVRGISRGWSVHGVTPPGVREQPGPDACGPADGGDDARPAPGVDATGQ